MQKLTKRQQLAYDALTSGTQVPVGVEGQSVRDLCTLGYAVAVHGVWRAVTPEYFGPVDDVDALRVAEQQIVHARQALQRTLSPSEIGGSSDNEAARASDIGLAVGYSMVARDLILSFQLNTAQKGL